MERGAVAAGSFYDWDKENLARGLEKLSEGVSDRGFLGCVSPHAGYVYSGNVAAKTIGSMKPGKRFIVLGPNHTGLGANFAVYSSGSWETPLGRVPIDHELSEALMKFEGAESDEVAHGQEHSIEVILPFLQHFFGEISFVPIAILSYGYGDSFLKRLDGLGGIIAGIVKKEGDVRVVASSDFSHFISADAARKRDMEAIEAIKRLDTRKLFRSLSHDGSVCGYAPIAVLLSAARELGWKAELIDYTNSGEVTGDKGEVVAYAGIGFK
jgi:AmmeMemoRadiSam system protein B